MIRRIAVACTLALAIGVLFAAPAGADRPQRETVVDVILGADPCAGNLHIVTIVREIRFHDHGEDRPGPFRASNTGTTTSGYVMEHGTFHGMVMNGILRFVVSDQWRHPDGRKYHVTNVFSADVTTIPPTILENRFTARCLGGG